MLISPAQLVCSANYACDHNSLTIEENIMLTVLNLKREEHKTKLTERAQQLYIEALVATSQFLIAQSSSIKAPIANSIKSSAESITGYSTTELLIVKEAAKLALYDAEFRDDIADTLDISDDVIRDVSIKLQKDLAGEVSPTIGDELIESVLIVLASHPEIVDSLREAIDASRNEISIIYDTSDVINEQVSPELTEDEAYSVLSLAKKNMDMNEGISWSTLKCDADYLFEADSPRL